MRIAALLAVSTLLFGFTACEEEECGAKKADYAEKEKWDENDDKDLDHDGKDSEDWDDEDVALKKKKLGAKCGADLDDKDWDDDKGEDASEELVQ